MLVEAARLGATPSGTDVDPLAVEIIRHELQPPNEAEVSALARELLRYLSEETAGLFCSTAKGWEPLHYFYLHVVCCPVCFKHTPLYKSLVIARDLGKDGCVVRDFGVVAFCPECFKIHGLKNCHQVELRCCGRRPKLNIGNFRAGKFNCPHCGHRATHAELGARPRNISG
jgi:putative DNA methylase